MKRLDNYIKTLKAECAYSRGDVDEDTACSKVIARLETIQTIKEIKHYTETLKIRIDNAGNGHLYKFYEDVRNKLKDIIKRENR